MISAFILFEHSSIFRHSSEIAVGVFVLGIEIGAPEGVGGAVGNSIFYKTVA